MATATTATTATATATATVSLPPTRISSPALPSDRTYTPPPPASKPIPSDFRSSLAAWWNNASYKEARFAEERLLRRIEIFEPTAEPEPEPAKGWFGWSSTSNASASGGTGGTNGTNSLNSANGGETKEQANATASLADARSGEAVGSPIRLARTGLVSTLRNVFIPTPDPSQAPEHPADPLPTDVGTTNTDTPFSSTSSLPNDSTNGTHKHLKKINLSHHKHKNDKNADYINTLEISSPENAASKEAVVVLHGYAAALGFFFRNWDAVARSSDETGRRTFFLDWLGMGLSSRPSPSLLNSPSSTPIPARVARAEHFFVSSLESWRASVGLEKMVIIGHSLGGYLASAYAVRYPHRVSGLVLVSPAGIPHGPEYKRYRPTGERNEAEERDQAVEAAEMEMNDNQFEAKGEAKQWQNNREQSATRRYMMKFFLWSWERGVSPFTFLRNMGPWGPMFAARYTQRRFAAQSEEDRRDIHSYIYNTSILKGSGEFCISHILAPGAYARIPIVDRIGKVKVPVTFMYGDNDWMDVDGGHASVEELRKAGNNMAKVQVVPKAGHHVYLDNPEDTNKMLDAAIKALPRLSSAAAA